MNLCLGPSVTAEAGRDQRFRQSISFIADVVPLVATVVEIADHMAVHLDGIRPCFRIDNLDLSVL